ncbi:hypothetical protein L1887_37699 [Cichorium endivia]|nr:hypothetical protein L1887_37699 [Cichorium endivia]
MKISSKASMKRVFTTSHGTVKRVGKRLKSSKGFGDFQVIETYEEYVDLHDLEIDEEDNITLSDVMRRRMNEKNMNEKTIKMDVSLKKSKQIVKKKAPDKDVEGHDNDMDVEGTSHDANEFSLTTPIVPSDSSLVVSKPLVESVGIEEKFQIKS